jgi:hypothetical protein
MKFTNFTVVLAHGSYLEQFCRVPPGEKIILPDQDISWQES